MTCFVGLVSVLGVFLNPCNINKMVDTTVGYDDKPACYIEFNSGNAWSGTDNAVVATPCTNVQEAIEKAKKENAK